MNFKQIRLVNAAIALGFAALSPLALAQPTAPDAAQLLQNINKTNIQRDFGNAPSVIQDVQTRKRLGPPKTGADAKIDVQGFNVIGLTAPSKVDVRKLLAAHIGAGRTFDQLEIAAEALQVALRQDGFFLAQVDIPKQAIKSGVIELRVILGYLDTIEVKPLPARTRADKVFIERILASHLQQGQVLTVAGLERALYLIGDMSGIAAESVIEQGARPGTAKLIISVKPTADQDASMDFDNYGSRYTGEFRVNLSGTFNAPFKRGDQFKLTGMTTLNEGTQFLRAAYQTPVGTSGLKIGVAASGLTYKLGTETFKALEASGSGNSLTVFALYPVVRGRNSNLFLQANVDRRSGQDKQAAVGVDNRSHATVLSLSTVGDARDSLGGGGISNFNVGLVTGVLTLDTDTLLAADQAATGRKTNGNYSKLAFGVARQQHLWNDAAQPANRLVLFTSLQGQMAAKNLSSGEKMALGGPAGVRAYAGGEGTGDNAYLVTWELRKSILGENVKGDLVMTVFGDYGYALPNKTILSTDTVRDIRMAGHGVGLNWIAPNGLYLKISVAQRNGYKPVGDPEDRLPRVYFSLSKAL
jgi:hemolysin activation/secretion protein